MTKDRNAELQGSPFVVDQRQEQTRVTLEIRALTVECQLEEDGGEHIRRAIDLLERINEASPLPALSLVRWDAYCIEAYSLPFYELVELRKRKYFRSSGLVDAGTDVGMSIDTTDGTLLKHVTLGPMEPEQLKRGYLTWPVDDLPPQFVFANLAQERNEEKAFDAAELGDFLRSAVGLANGSSEKHHRLPATGGLKRWLLSQPLQLRGGPGPQESFILCG